MSLQEISLTGQFLEKDRLESYQVPLQAGTELGFFPLEGSWPWSSFLAMSQIVTGPFVTKVSGL